MTDRPETGAGPLNVLHLLPHLEQGGTQRWVLDVVAACRDQGIPIHHHVAVLGSRDEMRPEFERSVGPVHRIPLDRRGARKLSALPALVRLTRELQVDLLQAHSRFERPYAYLLGRVLSIPVVSTLHSEFAATRYAGPTSVSARLRDGLERRLERRARVATLAVSPHLLELWTASHGPPSVLAAALPPSVAKEFFERRAPLPAPDEPLTLVSVARLVDGKGIGLAIEALAGLRRVLPAVSLTVVGDGPDRERLVQLASDLGLGDSVTFLGNRSDISSLLTDHHMFVLPSSTEGLGKAVLEAACAGLSVCVPPLPSLVGLLALLERVQWIYSLDASGVEDAIIRCIQPSRSLASQDADVETARRALDPAVAARTLEHFFRSVLAAVPESSSR